MYKSYNKKRSGSTVIVYDNDINRAINQLRHISAPIIKEAKMKRFFESNTAKRRRKEKESMIRERTKRRKMEQFW